MPGFERIDTVILRVQDYEAALAWYVSTLGFAVAFTDAAERLAVLSVGSGASLTLWELKADEAAPPRDAAGAFPIFAAGDAAAAHRALAERGARVSEVIEGAGVRSFTFWDLDGNRLEACEVLGGSGTTGDVSRPDMADA